MRRATAGAALVAAGLAGLVLFGSAEAHALNRKQAQQVALEALRPSLQKTVLVLGLPSPLPSTAIVEDAGPGRVAPDDAFARAGLRRVSSPAGSRAPIGRKAWLFWADLVPGSLFSHPSILVLVDATNGSILRLEILWWGPLVNGRRPAFLASRKAYGDSKYRVYGQAPRSSKLRSTAQSFEPPAEAAPGECVVLLTDVWKVGNRPYTDGVLHDDADRVRFLRDTTTLPFYEAHTAGELDARLRAAAKRGCKLVTIAVVAHGYAAPYGLGDILNRDRFDAFWRGMPSSTSAQIQLHDPPKGKLAFTSLDAVRLKKILGARNKRSGTEFNLVVESCFAGRWGPALRGTPGVLNVLTSSGPDTITYANTLAPEWAGNVIGTLRSKPRTSLTTMIKPLYDQVKGGFTPWGSPVKLKTPGGQVQSPRLFVLGRSGGPSKTPTKKKAPTKKKEDCRPFEITLGRVPVKRPDGTYELGLRKLRGCFPPSVTLTIDNKMPANILVEGSGSAAPNGKTTQIKCGGSELTRGSGNVCTATFAVGDPAVNLSSAFYPPRVVLRAIVAPPADGTGRLNYRVEWKVTKGKAELCGGNAYSEYCEIYMGKVGSTKGTLKLAAPQSVTISVSLEAVS